MILCRNTTKSISLLPSSIWIAKNYGERSHPRKQITETCCCIVLFKKKSKTFVNNLSCPANTFNALIKTYTPPRGPTLTWWRGLSPCLSVSRPTGGDTKRSPNSGSCWSLVLVKISGYLGCNISLPGAVCSQMHTPGYLGNREVDLSIT